MGSTLFDRSTRRSSGARWEQLGRLEQASDGDVQSVSQRHEVFDRDVGLSVLKPLEEPNIEIGGLGQAFLRQASLVACLANVGPDVAEKGPDARARHPNGGTAGK